jgi:hypothetical protein
MLIESILVCLGPTKVIQTTLFPDFPTFECSSNESQVVTGQVDSSVSKLVD